MDQTVFWTAFGAIGGTLGAFATAAAVVVALWQTKHSEKKSLKLTFSDSMRLMGTDEYFINLSITNVGNRKVIIDKWGFYYHNKKIGLLNVIPTEICKCINPTLPSDLDSELRISLFFEQKTFVAELKKGIKEGKFKFNKKVDFFAIDTTGKYYFVRSPKSVAQMISEFNRTV